MKNLHEYLEKEADRALQGECTAQKRLSEREVEMDRISWEKGNSNLVLFETNQQLESLYQANQWANQAQREKTEMRNRIFQEDYANKLP